MKWKQSFALLHQGDEQWSASVGEVGKITLFRNHINHPQWTVCVHFETSRSLVQLFNDIEEAKAAGERVARKYITEALAVLVDKQKQPDDPRPVNHPA